MHILSTTFTRQQFNQSTVGLGPGEIYINAMSHLLLVQLRVVPHVLLAKQNNNVTKLKMQNISPPPSTTGHFEDGEIQNN